MEFKLPDWITSMSGTLKVISVLLVAVIAILGVTSQVWSFGLDWQTKIQQIEKNKSDIAHVQCMRKKEKLESDLSFKHMRLATITADYLSKAIVMPKIIKDEYVALPGSISKLGTDIIELKCGDK